MFLRLKLLVWANLDLYSPIYPVANPDAKAYEILKFISRFRGVRIGLARGSTQVPHVLGDALCS